MFLRGAKLDGPMWPRSDHTSWERMAVEFFSNNPKAKRMALSEKRNNFHPGNSTIDKSVQREMKSAAVVSHPRYQQERLRAIFVLRRNSGIRSITGKAVYPSRLWRHVVSKVEEMTIGVEDYCISSPALCKRLVKERRKTTKLDSMTRFRVVLDIFLG